MLGSKPDASDGRYGQRRSEGRQCTYFAYGLRHVGLKVAVASRRAAAESQARRSRCQCQSDKRGLSVLPQDLDPMCR